MIIALYRLKMKITKTFLKKYLQIKLKKKRQDVILTATQCSYKNNITKQIHTFQFSQGQSVLHQQWKEPETLSTSNKWAAYHQLLIPKADISVKEWFQTQDVLTAEKILLLTLTEKQHLGLPFFFYYWSQPFPDFFSTPSFSDLGWEQNHLAWIAVFVHLLRKCSLLNTLWKC